MAVSQILIADDDTAIRTVLSQTFSRAGYDVRVTANATTLWNWIARGDGHLVVTDVVMPDGNSFDLMPKIRNARPDLPVIILSAQNTFMTAVKASEAGAYDYLPKPFDLTRLLAIAERALAERGEAEPASAQSANGETVPMVGRSPAMQEVYRILARLMHNDLTLMITGESGTGKELVARAVHDFGKRRSGPFVAINLAAVPKDMVEAELFGHEPGVLGQTRARLAGRFEQAEGGTLFLDEIGDMPMDAQTRLLRVLQQGEYTTLGGITPIRTDVRIIAAANRDLRALIRKGTFREDLFYRLNVVPLRLPPLRERSEDIVDLVRHFLAKAVDDGLAAKTFSSEAYEALRKYPWPGNVRELENLVRRVAALYSQETIGADIVAAELGAADVPGGVGEFFTPGPVSNLGVAAESYLARLFELAGDELPPAGLYQRVITEVEAPLITAALTATGGNQIRAAALLGLNRNTLRKKIRELGIQIVRGPR